VGVVVFEGVGTLGASVGVVSDGAGALVGCASGGNVAGKAGFAEMAKFCAKLKLLIAVLMREIALKPPSLMFSIHNTNTFSLGCPIDVFQHPEYDATLISDAFTPTSFANT